MDRLEFVVALANALANARCWWPLTVLAILFVLWQRFVRPHSSASVSSPKAATEAAEATNGAPLERALDDVQAVLPMPTKGAESAAVTGLPIAVTPEIDAHMRGRAQSAPSAAIATTGALLADAADFTASALGLAQATPAGQRRTLADSRALLAVSSRVDSRMLEALQRLEVLIGRVERRERGFAEPSPEAALRCWSAAATVIGQLCGSIAQTRRVTAQRTEQLAVEEGPTYPWTE